MQNTINNGERKNPEREEMIAYDIHCRNDYEEGELVSDVTVMNQSRRLHENPAMISTTN